MEFDSGENLGRLVLQDEQGRSYALMDYGFISFGDVARNLLGEQCQYASRYIDPAFFNHPVENSRYPNLAVGLRVSIDTIGGNYHAYGIDPKDVDEFVARYTAYKTYKNGYIEEDGDTRELTRKERRGLESYLKKVGAIET